MVSSITAVQQSFKWTPFLLNIEIFAKHISVLFDPSWPKAQICYISDNMRNVLKTVIYYSNLLKIRLVYFTIKNQKQALLNVNYT